jgi:uncharacterized protein with HEPN domain
MPSASEQREPRDWRLYLLDMEIFAKRAMGYCSGLDQQQFEANPLVQDAVLRNIELIGEAAGRIPDEFRQAHPEIQWRQIVAMRNQLIHGYLGIDLDIVWDVVCVELPALLRECQNLGIHQSPGE